MMQAQRLDSVADITMGQAPEGESYNLDGEGMPLIAGAGDFGELHPEPKKFTTAPGKTCQTGDVILGIRATIGEKVLADGTYCLGRGVAGLRAKSGLDERYLWHWLTHVAPYLAAKAKGATFKQVNREDIGELRITLPPLPEQRRIAEILDKADALRAKRSKALAQLDTLTQSIFLDMFGDPATNPKGWPWHRLGDVSDFFAGSTLPEGEPFTGQVEGHFLLKVSDMNLPGNDVYLKTCQQWSEVPGAASCTCPEGSVVIPKRGGAIGTNKKRITTRPSVLDPNLMAIVPRRGQTGLQFLYAWLLRLDLASITSGSSVPQLNKRDLDPLSIAVPPVDLQQEFSRRVGKVEKVVGRQHGAASLLEVLFASLQDRAFRGEL
jgi:type I restriction enzyme S subunit